MRITSWFTLACALAASCFALPAHAQGSAMPSSRPITLIVTIAPGGSMDSLARIYAEKLKDQIQHNVVVENRTGAGAALGTEYVARATPDGHTILLMDTSTVLQNLFQKNVTFDTVKDFEPLAKAAEIQLGLFANPSLGATDVKGLIAYGRANPGKLSAGFGGIGTPHHLAGAMLNMETKLDITLVPYRGSALSVTDLLGGQIPLIWSTPPAVLPHVRAGKVNGIAVTSAKRIALLPQIETFAEGGLPGVRVDMWLGFAAPKGTPQPFVERFSKAIGTISEMPDVRRRLTELGFEIDYQDSDKFRAQIAGDFARYGKAINDAGIAAK
jgi:tripartite-type tricarboxylate transporter receptor subunit TctC